MMNFYKSATRLPLTVSRLAMAMASAFSVLPKGIFKTFLCMDSKRSSVCVSWEISFHHSKKDVYPTQVWREMFLVTYSALLTCLKNFRLFFFAELFLVPF